MLNIRLRMCAVHGLRGLLGRLDALRIEAMNEKPLLAITMGDPAGVGPETIAPHLVRSGDA